MDYFNLAMTRDELQNISSLGLAHIGDAVFELMTRAHICKTGKLGAAGMHKAAVSYVNAHAQAGFIKKLEPILTDEERAVYKRARNTKVNSVPKSSDIDEYHAATGLEALFGYLFLTGHGDRLNELFGFLIET